MKFIANSLLFLLLSIQVLAQQDEYVRGNGWEAVRFMKSEGVLIVYYYENKPFIYTNEEGNLQGIEHDLLNQFRNYLKAKHNIAIKLIWKRAESTEEFHKSIARGDRGSIGIGAVTITDDNQHHYKYSPPYMSDISVLITNSSIPTCDNIDTFREQFGNLKAVSIQNSSYERYYDKLKKIILPKLQTQYVRNNDQIVKTLNASPNTFAYVQLPSYLLALKEGEKVKRHKWFMESNENGYGFLLPVKTTWDEPLLEFFNNVTFKDSVNVITTKYLGADISDFITELKENGSQEERSGEGNEIAVLDKENAINQLRIKEQELEAIGAKTSRNQLLLVGVFILMAATIFYFRFRAKQKANIMLEKLNEALQAKNEEVYLQAEEIAAQHEEISKQKHKVEKLYEHITDSIRYARRIQEAILPDKKLITEVLPDSFVYFNPKDGLSGDFYWFAQVKHLKIIASIDCTGHGIPGAFMTVMANTLLNQIVLTNQVLSPQKILVEMDKGVQDNMNKSIDTKRKMHDGMDMAICVIDETVQQIAFAAANQPMCYVSNNELYHVKGSGFPIGGFQFEQKEYGEILVTYRKGDMFYLYSDGYQDQFGGAEGRKYMSKRFRHFLLQIHHLEPSAQEAVLRREIQAWRGTQVQTDDQMVIGFKL